MPALKISPAVDNDAVDTQTSLLLYSLLWGTCDWH